MAWDLSMAVNKQVLKYVIGECCRSLSYDYVERQFSFPLSLSLVIREWDRISSNVRSIDNSFYSHDLDQLILRLGNLLNDCALEIVYESIADSEIMVGEVVKVTTDTPESEYIFVKMKEGQYLNSIDGRGVSLGNEFIFHVGYEMVTSEGDRLGVCTSINIETPSALHVCLSGIFIQEYYRNAVAESLWPIYDNAISVHSRRITCECNDLIYMSREYGINSFTLLHILKAASSL